jgi:hypothetical protein
MISSGRCHGTRRRTYDPWYASPPCLGVIPQDLAGAAGAFGHRREFGPADRGMSDPRPEPAIGAGQHVLAADQAGIAHQPLGDEVGVLDEIGAMADDAGD